MCEISAYVAYNKATNGQTDIKHKMGEKTLSSMLHYFISVHPFVALLNATYAENSHIVFF